MLRIATLDQNLDAQNRPDNSALFNESLILMQFTVWTRLYCLSGCLSEFEKKDNWCHGGPESRCSELPQQFSSVQRITKNPGYCMNPSILSARLPIRILNKKRWDWCHGGPESGRSELPRQLSPFQRITTNPGCCVNPSSPSAYQNFEQIDKLNVTVDQNLDA